MNRARARFYRARVAAVSSRVQRCRCVNRIALRAPGGRLGGGGDATTSEPAASSEPHCDIVDGANVAVEGAYTQLMTSHLDREVAEEAGSDGNF